MGEAIFGLIGVVVGALATGASQLFIERLRERREERRAKLLVAGELLHAQCFLRAVLAGEYWPSFDESYGLLPSSAWQESRARLACVLDEDLWNQLVNAYALLEYDRARFNYANRLPVGTPLTVPVIEGLRHTVRDLGDLRRRLGGGGGWLDEIDGYEEREQ